MIALIRGTLSNQQNMSLDIDIIYSKEPGLSPTPENFFYTLTFF